MDPSNFGFDSRRYGSSRDGGLAVAFLTAIILFGGVVAIVVAGSAWRLPDPSAIIAVETRAGGLFNEEQRSSATGAAPGSSAAEPVALLPTPAPTPGPERYYVVGNTGGDGAWLHRTPQLDDQAAPWPDGVRMDPIGPDVQAEGMLWHHVRDPSGNEGYIPSRWLIPVDPPPAAETAAPAPAQPTATPTPEPAAPQVYVVGNTGGSGGVWLRRTPQLDDRLRIWPDGARMVVVGPDVQAGGRVWKHVRDPQGSVGYIPLDWLIQAQ